MSDDPISVPVEEMTDAQKAEQEKSFAQSDLLTELVGQLKPKAAAMMSSAHGLGNEPTRDQLSALVDEIAGVASAGRDAQGRMDSLDCPKGSYIYQAIQALWEHCDLAYNDARQARDAAGDNDEVRATACSNMMQNLEVANSRIQQA